MRAWIGLGGNRPGSAGRLEQALAALDDSRDIRVRRRSKLYRSPAWGVEDQPDFVNAVAEVETELSATELLERMLRLERNLGRRRGGERWGPRCIDLDLLSYQDVILKSDRLDLPHPRMHQRAFVLVPLLELEPGFVVPGRGEAAGLLQNLPPHEVSAVVPLEPDMRAAP